MASPAAAAAEITDVAPRKGGGKKKLIVISIVVLLVLAIAGAGAVLLLKKRAAAAEDAEGEESSQGESHVEKIDPKVVPAFVALDMFTVNLADREAERYAQIGVTLELVDSKSVDRIKSYMPAVRSNILLVLSQKTSAELLDREGKAKLAAEILRESVKPLGYEIEAPDAAASGTAKKKKVSNPDDPPPVRRVHFSNFIIQ